MSDGELVRVLPDPGGWADSLAFVDDATLAAWDGLDVRTWQLADGTLMHSWGGWQPPRWNPEAPYWGANAALAPDGTTLGWMLKDRVRLSRADDGALLRDFGRHRWQGGRVVFSPDGSLLAVLSLGGIDLFRIADGARLPGYPRTDPGKSIALSPDGAILAAGTYRGGVAMSRVSDGALLRGLVGGHKDFVESLAFSPDGATLASGARDGTLCLWGLEP